MSNEENLLETVIDLKRVSEHEERLRRESDAVLAGLRVVISSSGGNEMFNELLEVLRDLLYFKDACVITGQPGQPLRAVAATCDALRNSVWEPEKNFQQILDGRPAAFFNVQMVPEWRQQSETLLGQAKSALHAPLLSKEQRSMLVCTHPELGFFSNDHVRAVSRFAPLATQALMNVQAQETLVRQHRLEREKATIEEQSRMLQVAHSQAVSASRAKSGFLAAMSHEIRTPMNALLGIFELLEASQLEDVQRKLVRVGRDSGELLLTIINSILDFSKMEADKITLDEKPLELRTLFAHGIELLRNQADEKKLSVCLDISSNVPLQVIGDSARLRQVLINLVGNAIKFTDDGEIKISVTATPASGGSVLIRFSVSDTGIGIPESFRSRLFDDFSMGDPSFSRKQEGTGLGLAICKRLVELMKGSIAVESTLGVGSTFIVTVQLEVCETISGEKDRVKEVAVPPGTHLLLAEDNRANQMINRALLEGAGFTVDVVANGAEAVAAVERGRYELVLMDVSMPEMDGIEATRAIRELNCTSANVPIVALTAHAMSGDRERFIDAGMNDYLTKPINLPNVIGCVSHWLGADEATAQTAKTGNESELVALVDVMTLKQLAAETSREMLPELVAVYVEDTRMHTERIQAAASINDIKELQFECHTVGSSAAAFGNLRLHQSARMIEGLCHNGLAERAIDLVDDFVALASISLEAIESQLNEPDSILFRGRSQNHLSD